MRFDDNCIVIAVYGNHAERVNVTSKAEAWRVARKFMLKGYSVAFSNALILGMHQEGR